MKLVLTSRLHLYWLAFSVGRCYACYWGRKVITNLTRLQTLCATLTTGLARHVYWCNRGANVTEEPPPSECNQNALMIFSKKHSKCFKKKHIKQYLECTEDSY